jgi:maltooligosyltrehalose trehalohydrolase
MTMSAGDPARQLGAWPHVGGVTYRVWAQGRGKVVAHIEALDGKKRKLPLAPQKEDEGYFSAVYPEGRAGDLYKFSVDGGDPVPDFASRYQPQGVTGPSQVVDPTAFAWRAGEWKRPAWNGQVVYECHLGTFTPEGTSRAAIGRLEHLCRLGVTAIEIMPMAETAGERNWGYDGVMLGAPYHPYGTPDDFRALIDACHLAGLAVILDVVFNHLGPEGNFSHTYSDYYFHEGKDSPWGTSFNLHGPHSEPVRAYLRQVMRQWLDEFRIDGFRMDATHAVHDESEVHLLAEVAAIVHDRGGFIIAEDERNARLILEPREKQKQGWGFDAAWADDFHHVMRVGQTHESHHYYGMVTGTAQELARTLEQGWLFVGQISPFHKCSRGTPCDDFPPQAFVYCISNHDQVGNRLEGERLHDDIAPEAYQALSLFLCLVPFTPMLFMGQEWAAGTPFHFFTDMPEELGKLIAEGRKREFLATALVKDKAHLRDALSPQDPKLFEASKLKWDELEREPHRGVLELYRAGLRLRTELFGRRNPPRESWRVEERPFGVGLHYTLEGGRKVAVQMRFKGDAGFAYDPHRLILDSNNRAFGGEGLTADGPEVLVLEE